MGYAVADAAQRARDGSARNRSALVARDRWGSVMGWIWSETERQYHDDATGDVIGRDEMKQLQTDLVAKLGDQFRATASDLYNRGASPDEWEQALRPLVDRTQAIGYQLARGGSAAMSDGDWQTVATQIEAQYGYLYDFSQAAGTGQIDEQDAIDRAGLYADAARGGASRGTAAAWGADLPEHPPLHPSCGCEWSPAETDDGVQFTWQIQSANPCPECLAAQAEYSPFLAA